MTTFVETKYAPANTAEDSRPAVSNEVEEVRYATAQSPLGCLLVARSDRGVCAVLLGNDARELGADLKTRMLSATLEEGDDACVYIAATLVAHVEGPSVPLDFTLDMRRTTFQMFVWKTL